MHAFLPIFFNKLSIENIRIITLWYTLIKKERTISINWSVEGTSDLHGNFKTRRDIHFVYLTKKRDYSERVKRF